MCAWMTSCCWTTLLLTSLLTLLCAWMAGQQPTGNSSALTRAHRHGLTHYCLLSSHLLWPHCLGCDLLLSDLCLYKACRRLPVEPKAADHSLESLDAGFLDSEQMLAMLKPSCSAALQLTCKNWTLLAGETLQVNKEAGLRKDIGLTTADVSWMMCAHVQLSALPLTCLICCRPHH